jgi:hypothetical protein
LYVLLWVIGNKVKKHLVGFGDPHFAISGQSAQTDTTLAIIKNVAVVRTYDDGYERPL